MTVSIGQRAGFAIVKTKDEEKLPVGTHQGRIEDPDARARRRDKNARNRSRRGQATRVAGSARRAFRKRVAGRGVKSSGR